MEGPDLSRVGLAGYDSGWHDKHVRQSQAGEKPGWKGAFPAVEDEDRELLKIFLHTRVAAPALVAAKSVFFSQGCLGCHKVSGVGGDDGPDLSRAGEKDPGQVSFRDVPGEPTMRNWMAEHFRAPASVVVGSQMPPVTIPSSDIEQLTMYTLSLRRKEMRDLYVPKDRALAVKFGEREFASDGATLFGAFCAGCHGQDGMGRRLPGLVSFPSIANPDFLALASDEFVAETIKKGRPGRRMPGWLREGGLRETEILAVISHLRTLGGELLPSRSFSPAQLTSNPSSGKRIFDATCSGCHGKDGRGGEGPALNNQVLLESATDAFFMGTIRNGRRGTPMAAFSEPSPVRAALTDSEISDVVAHLRSFQGDKQ